jgi:hypothetical protein
MAGAGMQEETESEILGVLREIRDGQREAMQILQAQRRLVEEQIKLSRGTIEESVGLQRVAVQRQRTITLIAVPGIIACLVAIAYLVLRYL